ncbi:MAG TPA: hypothetical protein VG346_06000 [Acidimicrobiales bacterium]|nr:hypothetical protein [Acidimicrobiales bacterium]
MEFSQALRDDIAAGDITVSVRLWRSPHAKVGGRYRVGRVEIEVDAVARARPAHPPVTSTTCGY